MMTCLSVQRGHLIGQIGPYLYAKCAKALLVGPGARSSGDLSCTLTVFQRLTLFQYKDLPNSPTHPFSFPFAFHKCELFLNSAPPTPEYSDSKKHDLPRPRPL